MTLLSSAFLLRKFTVFIALVFAMTLQSMIAVTIDDFDARVYDPDSDPETFNMPHRLFVPEDFDANENYPLIIYLHGLGSGNGDNIKQMENHGHGGMYFAEDAQQAMQPSFVVLPQEPGGTSQHWHQGEIKQLLIGLIDSLLVEFPNIDQSRIYIGGISMGGLGTWNQLTTQPDKYAAGVILAGAGGTGGAGSIDHIPIWLLHSDSDGVVGVNASRNRTNVLRNSGAPVIYTEFDAFGHVIGPKSCKIPELYAWMIQQRLGEVAQGFPIVRITEYSVGTDLNISGFAGDETVQINSVDWANSAGGNGQATGTAAWSVDNIALVSDSNLINVTATGHSYLSEDPNGSTTINQAVEVDFEAPVGDSTAPILTTSNPSHTNFTLNTESASLEFSGTASDDTGVSEVVWQTDQGQNGIATGTAVWSANIPLELGLNRINLTASDAVGNTHTQVFYIIRKAPADNSSPRVRAGPDLLLSMPNNTTELDAALGDDGLPIDANVLWSKVSGPGAVNFEDENAVDTIATFSEAGTYVIRLTADDTEKSGTDEVTVVVTEEPLAEAGPGIIGVNCHGAEYLATDGTLYLSDRAEGYLFGGGAWQNLSAPVFGTPDPTIYQSAISARGSTIWDIPLADGEYVITLKFMNPNNLLNNRVGDFFIEGYRVLNDFDSREFAAQNEALDYDFRVTVTGGVLNIRLFEETGLALLNGVLVRNALTGPPENTPPIVDAGDDQSVALAEGVSLNGTVADDGLLPGNLIPDILWRKVSGPGNVTLADSNSVDTLATFSVAGIYVLELTANDGAFSASDQIAITVTSHISNTSSRNVRFDFGSQTIPSSGNWNLVRFPKNDALNDVNDTDGNTTPFDLSITREFRSRDTTGPSNTGLYPNEATFDSFLADKNRPGEVTLEDLDPAMVYDITIFASAAFDAANDGVGVYSISDSTIILNATGNSDEVITFTDMEPSSEGTIVLQCRASDDVGEAFINLLELTEKATSEKSFEAWIPEFYPDHTTDPRFIGQIADPDLDGLPNILEYALGANPSMPNAGLINHGMNDGRIGLNFKRLFTNEITYVVEASATLELDDWQTIATLPAGATEWIGPASIVESGSDPISVQIVDTMDFTSSIEDVRFIRLKVTGE